MDDSVGRIEAGRKANRFLLAIATSFGLVFAPSAGATTIIDPGFDLFTTQNSRFNFETVPNPQSVDFEGAPLGCYDFGDGCVDVGLTDTIVKRIELADLSGGSDTINIDLVALSLVSVAPIDLGFGAGFENLRITLNTNSPSLQSTMTIFDTGEGQPHGTFDSVLNFSYDVTGSVGGFYATIEETFNSEGNEWQHATNDDDFLPSGLVVYTSTFDNLLSVSAVMAPIPEPSGVLLFSVGMLVVGRALRRRAA
jgi:hypothetical protein